MRGAQGRAGHGWVPGWGVGARGAGRVSAGLCLRRTEEGAEGVEGLGGLLEVEAERGERREQPVGVELGERVHEAAEGLGGVGVGGGFELT